MAKDMGIECKLTQHLPQFGQPQETGESETRRCAVPVDRGGFQVREICHKEGRHEREPRRLDDQATTGAKDRTAEDDHGLRVCRAPTVNEYRWHGM